MAWGNMKLFFLVVIVMQVVICVKSVTVTSYKKTYGTGDLDLQCALDGALPGIMATKRIDADGTCQVLDWNWMSTPVYESGSTYMEKSKVVTTYNSPIVLGRNIELPMVFTVGSAIDMYIEFTANFSYAEISMMDTLEVNYDLYNGDAETVMILLVIQPADDDISIKNFAASWYNIHFDKYNFQIGPTYKLTFRALASEYQMLINDVEIVRFPHVIPPENARMLFFTDDVGMLLHRIDFVSE